MQANVSFGTCIPEAGTVPLGTPENDDSSFGYSNRRPVQLKWLFVTVLVTLLFLLSL